MSAVDAIERTVDSTRPDREAMERHAREILRSEIDFIPNAEFRVEDRGLSELALTSETGSGAAADLPADLPAHLGRLCQSELLTREQERALFREMNYLKFRASELRSRLDAEQIDLEAVAAIESLLREAQAIRDQLIQANTRLVMSIVKKFVTPQQSYDEMLSNGLFTLMRAVEKFDYDRGFRFSTYAYRSIARCAYQTVARAQKTEARFTRDAEAWAFEEVDDRSSSSISERAWSGLRELTTALLDQLDRREKFIIRSRFALGAHRKVRTFQYLADKLGVSKERVRQLEERAIAKLQSLAADCEIDELTGRVVTA